MPATDVTEATFEAEVLQSRVPVLVDFWADWCAPCKAIEPVVEQIVQQNAEKLRLVKINAEASPNIVGRLRVSTLPTLILFKNGQEASRIVGFKKKAEMQSKIEPLL